MQVQLEGKVFVFTGKLTKMTRHEAQSLIASKGARIGKSVGTKTDYVIVGERPSGKYIKAKNMGIPILSEDDFKALMEGDEVEVEDIGAAGDRSIDELLGELRSVMDGAPSAPMWEAIVRLVDECREEDVATLTNYVNGYIQRWSEESMKGQKGAAFDAGFDGKRIQGSWWYRSKLKGAGVNGELRVAPEAWVGQMTQGAESAKFELVRALDFHASEANMTSLKKVVEHPNLTHLQTIVFPEHRAPTKTLVKTLCTHKNCESLAHIVFSGFTEAVVEAFEKSGTKARGITSVDLTDATTESWYKRRPKSELIARLFATPVFSTLESVRFPPSSASEDFLDLLWNQKSNPKLHRIELPALTKENVHFVEALFAHPMYEAQIDELELPQFLIDYNKRSRATRFEKFNVLLDIEPSKRLKLLDLSSLRFYKAEKKAATVNKDLLAILPSSKLLGQVDKLVLGDWATDELVEALKTAFDGIEVIV